MSLLELNGVSKSYGAGASATHVLDDVSLRVRDGEFVAIVGYSGAGKSTLLSLMAGLVHPDDGQVLFDGRLVTGPAPDRAVVFQNYSLLPWLTVTGNVRLAVDQVFPNWTADRRHAHVERYVSMVNLAHARDRRPAELSGGMRQRVALARALAMDPRMLLMDEALGALDALTRATLQDEIERIWRGPSSGGGPGPRKTVVLITNDVDEGVLLADRIVPLSAGPRATLGPSVLVDLDRPRDRKTINHCPRFKAIRKEVFAYLLGPGASRRTLTTAAAGNVRLPELKPVEFAAPRRGRFSFGRA